MEEKRLEYLMMLRIQRPDTPSWHWWCIPWFENHII